MVIGGAGMSNETEKLTVNLGVVELAQIDVLVEQGLYSNRSDFIRTSIRKCLEPHKEGVERFISPIVSKQNMLKGVGILRVSKKDLESLAKENKRLDISVVGMLIIDDKVSVELFEKAVERVTLRGKLVASDLIKDIVKKLS